MRRFIAVVVFCVTLIEVKLTWLTDHLYRLPVEPLVLYTQPNMELRKKRMIFGILPFFIGLLITFAALESVSDPNTRHAVSAFGVVIEIVGVIVMFRTRTRP